jgi:hypothetical protein
MVPEERPEASLITSQVGDARSPFYELKYGHGSELREVRLTLFDSPGSNGGEPR